MGLVHDTMIQNISKETICNWLEEVKDPEIPVLSLVDLGVIREVSVEGTTVNIEITPTFVGCPALDYMKLEIIRVLKSHGAEEVNVEVTYRRPWTSDSISEKGKAALKEFGLAPPPANRIYSDLEILAGVSCPR